MEQQQFINSIAPYAVKVMQQHNILASLTIAQAILESGWGKSELAVKGNNLFGIKGVGPAGSITIETTEHHENGTPYRTSAEFRKYHSREESLEDHTRHLLQSPRYQSIIGEKDYKRASEKIQAAGYTNDPNYPSLLIGIIERHRLYEYDNQTIVPAPAPLKETGVVTIIAETLNLRSGPGMNYPVLRTLPKGSQWKVFGEAVNGFYNLGGDQWCSANPVYVSFTPSSRPAQAATSITGEIKLLVDLNLRSGPGMQYKVIRVMKKGESYKVFGNAVNGWYNLGGQQWCSANPSYVSYTPYHFIKVTADVLNVRNGPGTQYAVIKQIKRNETYRTYGYQNGWYNIGNDQWVSGGYVTTI
ncbi:MAG: glucosaminidase domain-containing protein [Ectobacillus sp.]